MTPVPASSPICPDSSGARDQDCPCTHRGSPGAPRFLDQHRTNDRSDTGPRRPRAMSRKSGEAAKAVSWWVGIAMPPRISLSKPGFAQFVDRFWPEDNHYRNSAQFAEFSCLSGWTRKFLAVGHLRRLGKSKLTSITELYRIKLVFAEG